MRILGLALVVMSMAAAAAAPTQPATAGQPAGCRATAADMKVEWLAGFCFEQFTVNATSGDEALPMVIALHWSTSTPAEFRAFVEGLQGPVRVILPQGPYPKRDGFSFYPVAINYYGSSADDKMKTLLREADKLGGFIAAVSRKYPAPVRPILIGASQGGDLSYAIAVRHPDAISLSLPLLATIDERIIGPKPANAVAIRVFHGIDDKVVPVADARHHVEALRKSGYDVRLEEYPGVGHDIAKPMQRAYLAMIEQQLQSARAGNEARDMQRAAPEINASGAGDARGP